MVLSIASGAGTILALLYGIFGSSVWERIFFPSVHLIGRVMLGFSNNYNKYGVIAAQSRI
jgi:hypothetical protein